MVEDAIDERFELSVAPTVVPVPPTPRQDKLVERVVATSERCLDSVFVNHRIGVGIDRQARKRRALQPRRNAQPY
jgi:hypothetical protein